MTIKADYHATIKAATGLKTDSRNARLKVSFEHDRQDATTIQLNADPGSTVAEFTLSIESTRLLAKLLSLR